MPQLPNLIFPAAQAICLPAAAWGFGKGVCSMSVKATKVGSLEELVRMMAEAKAEGAEVEFVNADQSEMPPELGKMLKGALIDDANKPTTDLARKLMEVAAIHASPPKFERGHFVRYREEVDYVRNGRGLHMVVDVLDPPIKPPFQTKESEGSCVAYRHYDVVIATAHSGGICKYLADSRELELFPDADKLMKKETHS